MEKNRTMRQRRGLIKHVNSKLFLVDVDLVYSHRRMRGRKIYSNNTTNYKRYLF